MRLAVGARWRSKEARDFAPELGTLQTAAARRAGRRAGPLAGVIQLGTSYSVASLGAYVTYEDQTVAEARRNYDAWRRVPQGVVKGRLERQRSAYQGARACCATSMTTAESIAADYDIPEEKIHVVGIGRNREVSAEARDWETPRFLFVGLEWERKNGPGVLRAFRRLKAEIPEAGLDVVGAHPAIGEKGVVGHGRLRLDRVDEKARLDALFAGATCFVLPSRYEPSAQVYVEAAAAGLPIIGTTEGGSELLIGEGGLLVAPSDEPQLLAAMRRMCDPAVARSLGEQARQRATLFTWQLVAERLVRALRPAGMDVEGLAPFLA